ncbi:MAG: DUF4411 family protein [Acidobacteriota bacterium]
MAYLLDANVFIQAKNLDYQLDVCPAFWDWLLAENDAGRVFSIEKVSDEIKVADDDLAQWAAARGKTFFLAPDTAMLSALTFVSNWVSGQEYEAAAVNTFLQGADYYLVAHALAHSNTVVTHELAAESISTVKIPHLCIGLGIQCMTLFEMLSRERTHFVLGTKGA